MATMSSLESQAVISPTTTGPIVWLNGTIKPLAEATTPAADHAHLYGDGLFEGIRFYDRRIFKLDEHLSRLYDGVNMLDIRGMMPVEELREIILNVCPQADLTDGYVRLNVSRGTGLGLDPWKINQTPNVMVMVNFLRLYNEQQYQEGLKVITCSTRVFPAQCLDPQIKTIGRYVANIQAKLEANRQGAGEGLMLNTEGHVAEATGDNIFVIHGNKVSTPTTACGILNGITRRVVMDIAANLGHDVVEERTTMFDVVSADEVFLTGTAAEIIGMISLDSRPIGGGVPGPITRKIMAEYHNLTHTTGTPF